MKNKKAVEELNPEKDCNFEWLKCPIPHFYCTISKKKLKEKNIKTNNYEFRIKKAFSID